jgi:hypothetical protein
MRKQKTDSDIWEIINEAFSGFQLALPCLIFKTKMDAVWSPSFFPRVEK